MRSYALTCWLLSGPRCVPRESGRWLSMVINYLAVTFLAMTFQDVTGYNVVIFLVYVLLLVLLPRRALTLTRLLHLHCTLHLRLRLHLSPLAFLPRRGPPPRPRLP